MISGNGVPTASDRDDGTRTRDDRQLRDIEDLIARLEVVNRQLSYPARPIGPARTARTVLPAGTPLSGAASAPGDAPSAEGPGTADRD